VAPVKYELGFYIPEDDILHCHCSENLKSYTLSDSSRANPSDATCTNQHIQKFVGMLVLMETVRENAKRSPEHEEAGRETAGLFRALRRVTGGGAAICACLVLSEDPFDTHEPQQTVCLEAWNGHCSTGQLPFCT
jgi:hypothetical protein